MTTMDVAQIERFLDEQFPQARALGATVVSVGGGRASLHIDAGEPHLRPGGTVSGPTLMALADTGAYLALLAEIGPRALAVTTSLTIHFMRKPAPGRIVAQAEIMKLGRRLAVIQVTIEAAGVEGPVAHATVTYAIPASGRD
jgi:uncharacterized protein (TIGR00369 family)